MFIHIHTPAAVAAAAYIYPLIQKAECYWVEKNHRL